MKTVLKILTVLMLLASIEGCNNRPDEKPEDKGVPPMPLPVDKQENPFIPSTEDLQNLVPQPAQKAPEQKPSAPHDPRATPESGGEESGF